MRRPLPDKIPVAIFNNGANNINYVLIVHYLLQQFWKTGLQPMADPVSPPRGGSRRAAMMPESFLFQTMSIIPKNSGLWLVVSD
jgi:hypothetical protein